MEIIMQYKALVFDFDLTLADSKKPILTCYKHTLKTHGYPMKADSEIFTTIGLELTKGLSQLTGETDSGIIETLRKTYAAKADEVMVRDTVFFDGTKELLSALRKNNIKYAIVSTKFRSRLLCSFDACNCPELVPDVVIGREDVANAKPDPSGLLRAMEILGADKSNTLYVGDSYIDAHTAQNAGVDFAGVLTGPATKEMLDEYKSVGIFDNIKSLSEWFVASL